MNTFLLILFIVVGISAALAIVLAQNAHKADEALNNFMRHRDNKQN